MLRSRASSRFAPLRSRRTLSVTGSVVWGCRRGCVLGAARSPCHPLSALMSRVTRSSFGVVRFQHR